MARSITDEDVGEPIPYDPQFNGPLKNRSCTDVICLLLFLVFIACWVGIGIYAFKNGDPNTLLVPKDSAGSRCGIDSHVKSKPYLFFFDLTKCLDPAVAFTGCPTTQVCVTHCPDEPYFSDGSGYKGDREFCNYYNEEECPSWYLKSTTFLNRCLYNVADRQRLNQSFGKIKGDKIKQIQYILSPGHMWIHNILAFFTENPQIHEGRFPNNDDRRDVQERLECTDELRDDHLQCYESSESTKRGYMARMHALWCDNHPKKHAVTPQNFCDYVSHFRSRDYVRAALRPVEEVVDRQHVEEVILDVSPIPEGIRTRRVLHYRKQPRPQLLVRMDAELSEAIPEEAKRRDNTAYSQKRANRHISWQGGRRQLREIIFSAKRHLAFSSRLSVSLSTYRL